jgi:hypothetical protein
MPRVERSRRDSAQRERTTRRAATADLDRTPSPAAAVQTALDAPDKLISPAILSLQRSAGNRAVQRVLAGRAGDNRRTVIQRRLSPPALGGFLNYAVRALNGSSTVFTRYELQATNPGREGVGTFIDVKGPLTG